MRSGRKSCSRLRHRLMLQEEVRVPDEAGGYARNWEDVAELWAEILPLSGRERFFADQLQSELSHRILLRYRDGVQTGMRFLFDSRAFNIRCVINMREKDDVLELLAEEGVA